MQVVTSENYQQLVTTGRVDEFKPPEAAKPADGGNGAEVAKPATTESTPSGSNPPRDESGRFTKAEEAGKSSTAVGAKPTEPDDDEGGDNLPEHARKVIGKKHRAMKEAEEFGRQQWTRAQAAETRAEQLERQLQESKAQSRPATATAAKEPQPGDFATVAEYTDALVKYRVAEELKTRDAEAAQRRQAEEKAAREAAFAQQIAAAKEKHEDFAEVVGKLSGTELDRVHTDVIEYIQESEQGAELLYHLATNPKDLDRFRKLSPRRFIAELGKLEAKLEAPATPKPSDTPTLSQAATTTTPPVVSKAPAPIAALSSDKSTVVNKRPEEMSFRELREFERQREAERRARA